jgi:hypothetical protein
MKIAVGVPATNLLPSADEATRLQFVVGAVVSAQVMPELVDISMGPFSATAIILVPSTEEAVARHKLLGAVENVQLSPELADK